MTRVLDPTTSPYWKIGFGVRYLKLRDFANFCQAVGLRSCTPEELEEYEQHGWLFASARLVTPSEYARAYREADTVSRLTTVDIDESLLPFHHLRQAIDFQVEPADEQDLRHPIDKTWGTLPELVKPSEANPQPWEQYRATVQVQGRSDECNLADHFYHYWQVYELYHVRRTEKGMYHEDSPLAPTVYRRHGDYLGIAQGFEAVSRFQHLQRRQKVVFLSQFTANGDREIVLSDAELETMKRLLRNHAEAVCRDLGVSSQDLYAFLNRLMRFHNVYELSERVKLAQTLEHDIWRTVELIEALTGCPTEEIAAQAGHAGGFVQPYLEVLFPNRRKQVLDKCSRILTGLADEEYNRESPNYAAREPDIEALVGFLENTDLSLFLYTVAEANDAFYARHSWRTAVTYLGLKSLASLPESLMRTIILNSGDTQLTNDYEGLPKRKRTLYPMACLLFQGREQSIWSAYENLNTYRNAADGVELATNMAQLVREFGAAQDEAEYLGATLALATLLRNFTSHHMLEDSALLQGYYLASVRSIVGTILLTWKVAQTQGWV